MKLSSAWVSHPASTRHLLSDMLLLLVSDSQASCTYNIIVITQKVFHDRVDPVHMSESHYRMQEFSKLIKPCYKIR